MGRGPVAVVALAIATIVACGKASSQDPGLAADDGGGGTGDEAGASNGVSCASAETLAKLCCGSGEPPATACAASWSSEELCVGGASFTQTLFPTPCEGLVASNDAYGGGVVTIFDAATGALVAIVKTNAPGLGLCAAADSTTRVIPASCLAQWESAGTAPCKPKPGSSFGTLCSSLSLPPQTCFVTAGSPPCALPTTCMFATTPSCNLDGVCLVPSTTCKVQSKGCDCVAGGTVTICDGFAPAPVSGSTCGDAG